MRPALSILEANEDSARLRLQRLTTLLGYTWGSRLVPEGDGGFDFARTPDSFCAATVGGVLEIERVTTWRRLDRGDVLHAIKIVMRALAPETDYRVTPAMHTEWEIALQAAVPRGGLHLPAGTYGLAHADAIVALGLDPGKASLLKASVPLSILPG